MIPIYILFQVSAAASQIELANQKRRRDMGLPPSLPPPKTPAQIEQERREDRMASAMLTLYIVLYGLAFAAVPTLFIYCVIKIAFARQGIQWP